MNSDINQAIDSFIKGPAVIGKIRFSTETRPASENALCVDFPRLEIMLAGQLHDPAINAERTQLMPHDVLYIPAGGWNDPQWMTPSTLLTILFGKQQLEFVLRHWDGSALNVLDKQQVPRRGPRVGSFLLQALNEMQMQPREQYTARFIVTSLLSHCADLLGSQVQTSSRSQALFEAIRKHIGAGVLSLAKLSIPSVPEMRANGL
ncbi:transcriptional regulator [Klebsiella pneumoniae]|nr:transcriptional regulator [Klebsiella pneumoniae]